MKIELTEDFVRQVIKQELGYHYRICDEMVVEIMKEYPCQDCRPEHKEIDRRDHIKFMDAAEVIFDYYGIELEEAVDDET